MRLTIIILFTAQVCFAQKHLQSLKTAAAGWEHAMENKKPDSVAYFFAKDVIAMYPHPLPAYGQEANLQIWHRVYENPKNTHPISVDEVMVADSGEMGYTMGKWWSSYPDQNAVNGGRYVAIWRKIDGEWKITRLGVNVHDDVKNDREGQ